MLKKHYMQNLQQEEYAKTIFKRLLKKYKNELHTQLKHKNNTELFVAVLLSPQSTDVQTNKVTKRLFSHFRTFNDYANAKTAVLESYLNGINYYRTKAKHLKESARKIVKNFNGKVPKDMKSLLTLPGVGRKVANVILSEGFGINEGIAVDTHVKTTAYRLGLTRSRDAEKIEKDLMAKFPKEKWGSVSNLLIALGRDTCTAKNRKCKECVLNDICPSSTVNLENH